LTARHSLCNHSDVYATTDFLTSAAVPVPLTAAFAENAQKQTRWRAVLIRTRLDDATNELSELIDRLHEFLWPPTVAAVIASAFDLSWLPELGWTR